MTDNDSSTSGTDRISVRDSTETLKPMLDRIANRRNISRSDLVREILWREMDKYATLSDDEKELVRVRQKELDEKLYKHIARDQKMDNTFICFISEQLYSQKERGASDRGIMEWIEDQKEIFELRGHSDRYDHFKNNWGEYYSAAKKHVEMREQFVPPELPEDGSD